MMKPFLPIDVAAASPKTRQLLVDIERRFSALPNFFRTIAYSENTLCATGAFHEKLSDGELGPILREAIIIAISARNRCFYCISAHAAFARQYGAERCEVADYVRGTSAIPYERAILQLALAVAQSAGKNGADAIATARAVGLTDAQIIETIAWSAFTQYLNIMADSLGVIIDFPSLEELGIDLDEAA